MSELAAPAHGRFARAALVPECGNMPRHFDSDAPNTRLIFDENVECPACREIFEGQFFDHTQSLSVQDMVEAPKGDHECPYCEHKFSSTISGWMFYSEAG